jgi:Holliday junction resolvase RusA-like endonuclease
LASAGQIELLVELPVPTSWSNKRRLAALAGAIAPTSKPDIDNYVKTAERVDHR